MLERGDSHNFGRRVAVGAKRVRKPRTLLWEWLLLAKASPLRSLLDDAAQRDGLGHAAFGFLPELGFRDMDAHGGEVERLRLRPLALPGSPARKRELSGVVGRSLALFSWLGVSDLHWENLALGSDARGRIVFAPLDIEVIFSDMTLPTETKLLPDADPEYGEECRHACGVRRVLPYLGKPVDTGSLLVLLSAYRSTLAFLDQQARAVAGVFGSVRGLREAPIRVCLRGTGDYVRSSFEPVWPPLLDAEREQLARGDIPYFFRFYGRRGLRYYVNHSLTANRCLPLTGDVPRLDPILSLSRGLRSPNRARLAREGLLSIVGAFDHPTFTGKHALDGLEVSFGARRLVVRFPDGEELHARRDLSAFVGSVYLPCRCGEVRSVFVPAVTRCQKL